MGRSSIATISSVLAVAAVHKLLLAVVAELARHLLEAGLHQGHVGEGNTGATLFLEKDFNQKFLNGLFSRPGSSLD